MRQIDPNDPRPPYQQIADDIRRGIAAGNPGPGERLRSSRELAAAYGVAPMTIHQAIRVLRDEGAVESWQGRGVFVREPSATAAVEREGTQAQLHAVREALGHLADRVDGKIADDIDDLRRQVGVLQSHLIDLYARTGHPYPGEGPAKRNASARRPKAASE